MLAADFFSFFFRNVNGDTVLYTDGDEIQKPQTTDLLRHAKFHL